MIEWRDLLAALALVLVIEGLLPFANPPGVRRALKRIDDMSDGQLRNMGAISMAIGVVLLYFVKN